MRKYIIDLLSPSRTWINDSDRSYNLTQNYYHWYAPQTHCSTKDLEAAWKDTGEGSAPLVSAAPNDTERAILKRAVTKFEVTNLNAHPMYVQVYWCTARDRLTRSLGNTDPHQRVIEYLVNGWKDRMLAADETSDLVQDGTTDVRTLSKRYSPFQSYRLRMGFKIKKGKGGWIRPGGTVNFTYKSSRDRAIRYEIIKDDSDHRAVPGLTVAPLFHIQTSMGVDTTDPTKFKPMDGYFHCKVYKTITYKFVDLKPALMAISNEKNTDTALTLIGPTEFADVADE